MLFPPVYCRRNIAKMNELLPQVINQFLSMALDAGPESVEAFVLADTSVTLAAKNAPYVSKRIISSTLEILKEASGAPKTVEHIQDLKSWDSLQVMTRFVLLLSFNNRLDVQQNLPELFHMITCLVATGPQRLRASIHSITVNILHSIITSLPFNDSYLRRVQQNLDNLLCDGSGRWFGIYDSGKPSESTMANMAVRRNFRAMSSGERQMVDPSLVNRLGEMLWEITECGGELQQIWQRRWSALATETAFGRHLELRTRAVVIMGIISEVMKPASACRDNVAQRHGG